MTHLAPHEPAPDGVCPHCEATGLPYVTARDLKPGQLIQTCFTPDPYIEYAIREIDTATINPVTEFVTYTFRWERTYLGERETGACTDCGFHSVSVREDSEFLLLPPGHIPPPAVTHLAPHEPAPDGQAPDGPDETTTHPAAVTDYTAATDTVTAALAMITTGEPAHRALALLDENTDFGTARDEDPAWPDHAERTAVLTLREYRDGHATRTETQTALRTFATALQTAADPAAAAPESIRAHLRNNPNTPQVLQTLEALTGFPCDFLTNPAAPGPSAAQLTQLISDVFWTSEGVFSATHLLDAARTLTAGGTIPDPDSHDGRAAHLLAALMTTADAQHLDGFQVAVDGLRDRLHRLLDDSPAHEAEVAAELAELETYLKTRP